MSQIASSASLACQTYGNNCLIQYQLRTARVIGREELASGSSFSVQRCSGETAIATSVSAAAK